MVREAASIILLEAVASGTSCSLKVVRVLKGRAEDAASVTCRLPSDGDWMTDFSSHTETSFWEGSGRLGIDGACGVIAPAFSVGEFYLALLGLDPDTKQFEQIGENDRWLRFVEGRIHASQTQPLLHHHRPSPGISPQRDAPYTARP